MLAVGQAAPIAVRAVAAAVPKSGGRLAVQGAVSAAGPSDPVPQNNRATDWLGGPAADVAVRLRREPEVAAAGSAATYTVQVSNTGPDVAGVVGVSLVLPTGAVVQQAPSGSGWQCAGNAGVFTCSRSALALGDAPPLSAQLTIPGSTSSEHLFAAVAAAPSVDPNLANNRASFEVPPFSVADLQLTLTRQPGAAGPGQPAQYVVQVANLGAGTVTAPTVVVRLPVGSAVSAPAQGSGWSCLQAAQALSCSRSVLAPGQAPPLTVGIYTPAPATSSTLAPAGVVSALVSAEQSTDPRPENNFAALELGTFPPTTSDLSLQLERSPELSRPGDEVTYQLQPMSSGPGLLYGATVAVVLPPQTLVTQPAAGSGWDCVAGPSAYLCTLDAPAAPGLLPPLSLKLLTPDVSQSGDPQLQASLSAAQNQDPQTDNNTVRSSLSGALLKLAGEAPIAEPDVPNLGPERSPAGHSGDHVVYDPQALEHYNEAHANVAQAGSLVNEINDLFQNKIPVAFESQAAASIVAHHQVIHSKFEEAHNDIMKLLGDTAPGEVNDLFALDRQLSG